MKESMKELADCLVEEEKRHADIFVPEDPAACASCANIPNMNEIDGE